MSYKTKFILFFAALLLLSPSIAFAIKPRDTIFVSDRYTTHVLMPTDIESAEAEGDASLLISLTSVRPEMVMLRAVEPFEGTVVLSMEDAAGAFRFIAIAYAPRPETLLVDLRPGAPASRLMAELPVIEVSAKKNLTATVPGRVIYADNGASGVLSTEVKGPGGNTFVVKASAPFKDSTNITLYDTTGTLHMYLVRYRKTLKTTTMKFKENPQFAASTNIVEKPREAPRPVAKDTVSVSEKYVSHMILPAPVRELTLPEDAPFFADVVEGRNDMIALLAKKPFDGTFVFTAEDTLGAYRLLAVCYERRPARMVADLRKEPSCNRLWADVPVVTASMRKDLRLLMPARVTYVNPNPLAYLTADIDGDTKSEVVLKATSAFKDTTDITIFDENGRVYSCLVRYAKNIKAREVDLRQLAPPVAPPVKTVALDDKKAEAANGARERADENKTKEEVSSVKVLVVETSAPIKAETFEKSDDKGKDKGKDKNRKDKDKDKDKGKDRDKEENRFAGKVTTDSDSFASALEGDFPVDEQPQAAPARDINRDTIYVSDVFTTHMIYPSEINYADLSNQKIVAAKIIEGSKNKMAIKAREPFSSTASLSVEESNGYFHTYIVAYMKHPDELVLDFRKTPDAVSGRPSQTIEISDKYTTHFIFGTDIAYADLSRPSILAGKLVDQGRNKLALKAKAPFSGLANVSIEEANGKFHIYYLKYAQSPKDLVVDARPSGKKGEAGASANYLKRGDAPSLQAVAALPRQLYHTSMREYHLTLSCENVFAYSDITYIVLSLKNDSGISYETEDAIFVLETKQGSRRRPPDESTILPKNKYGKLTTQAYGESRMAYSFEKITLAKNQRICIYIYESGGRRELKLVLTAADINGATSPYSAYRD